MVFDPKTCEFEFTGEKNLPFGCVEEEEIGFVDVVAVSIKILEVNDPFCTPEQDLVELSIVVGKPRPCYCANTNKECLLEKDHTFCPHDFKPFGPGEETECYKHVNDCSCSTDPLACKLECPGTRHDCICVNGANKLCLAFGYHQCTCVYDSKNCKADDEMHTCIKKKNTGIPCLSEACRRLNCRPCTCQIDTTSCIGLKWHTCTCVFHPAPCKSWKHECVCPARQYCRICTKDLSKIFEKTDVTIKMAKERQSTYNNYCEEYDKYETEYKSDYSKCPCSGNDLYCNIPQLESDNYIECTSEECTHIASSQGRGHCQCCNVRYRKTNNLSKFCAIKFFQQTAELQTTRNLCFSYKSESVPVVGKIIPKYSNSLISQESRRVFIGFPPGSTQILQNNSANLV